MTADRPEHSQPRRGLVGRVLGDRYRVTRLLSAGANTLIADADDTELGRTVTAKLVRPEWAESPAFRQRFAAAMRAVSGLSHPNIATVHDWGVETIGRRTTVFMIVEHLDGGSLRDLFDRGRYLDPSQALLVGLEACRGLDFAHRRGLVHTELTPAKLVFGDDRRLRIVDFGVARLFGEREWADPPTVATHVARYCSPEQALSQPVDGKSDVYSLALILVEAVSRTVPFAARSTVATLSARIGRLMPVSADLGPLAAVLERAGRPEAADRSTAAELGRALVRAAEKLARPQPIPILVRDVFEDDPNKIRRPNDPTGGIVRPPPVPSPPVVAIPRDVAPAAPGGEQDAEPDVAPVAEQHVGPVGPVEPDAPIEPDVTVEPDAPIEPDAPGPDVAMEPGAPETVAADDDDPDSAAASVAEAASAASVVAVALDEQDADEDAGQDRAAAVAAAVGDSDAARVEAPEAPAETPPASSGGVAAPDVRDADGDSDGDTRPDHDAAATRATGAPGLPPIAPPPTVLPPPPAPHVPQPPPRTAPRTAAPVAAAEAERTARLYDGDADRTKDELAELARAARTAAAAGAMTGAPPEARPAAVAAPEHDPAGATAWSRRLEDLDRPRRSWVAWLVAIVLVAGLGALGVLAYILFQQTDEHAVPDLVGEDVATAEAAIAEFDWEVEVTRERSDEQPVAGLIVRTSPEVGSDLGEGEPLLIVVSEGPELRPLPDVTGLPVGEAETALAELGLTALPPREAFDEDVPEGRVVRWSVPGEPGADAGTEVPPETEVALVVSSGPEPRTVPDLGGQTVEEATAALEALRLEVELAEPVFSDEVPEDFVVQLRPGAGEQVERGTTIVVTGSKGEDLVTVPDLRGLTLNRSRRLLAEAGLRVGAIVGNSRGRFNQATVDGERVAPGDELPRGTALDLAFT